MTQHNNCRKNGVTLKHCLTPSVCWDLCAEGSFVSKYPYHFQSLSSDVRNQLTDKPLKQFREHYLSFSKKNCIRGSKMFFWGTHLSGLGGRPCQPWPGWEALQGWEAPCGQHKPTAVTVLWYPPGPHWVLSAFSAPAAGQLCLPMNQPHTR